MLHYYGFLEQGNDFKIVCPFHNDINASMKINLDDGTYYCFGCGVSGNAISFVSLINKNMDDLQACIEYFKILKSTKVKKIHIEKRHKADDKEDEQLYDEAWDYYYGLKSVDWTRKP